MADTIRVVLSADELLRQKALELAIPTSTNFQFQLASAKSFYDFLKGKD